MDRVRARALLSRTETGIRRSQNHAWLYNPLFIRYVLKRVWVSGGRLVFQTLKAMVAGLWLLAATGSSSAFATNGEEFTLGEPILPHSSSLEPFDLPEIEDGQILTDALGPIDLSDVLSQYVGATTAPGMPTLDDYFLQKEIRDISLSPDGKRIAVIKRTGHAYYVYVIDLEQDRKVVYGIAEPKNQYFMNVAWLTPDRIGITVRSTGVAIVSSGRNIILYILFYDKIVAIGDDGSNPVTLLAADERLGKNTALATITSFLESDPDHVTMIAYDGGANLYKVNIHSGEGEKIVAGSEQTVGYIVAPDGEPLFRLDQHRSSKTVKIYQYDAANKSWTFVLSLDVDELREGFDKQLASLTGQKDLLLIDRKDGDEYTSLHRYNIKEDRYEEVIYSVDGYDLDRTLNNGANGEVIGVTYIDDKPRAIFFDTKYKRIQGTLEKAFPDGTVAIARISQNDRRYLFYTDEPWRPGTFYIYDDQEKKAHAIVDIAPVLSQTKTTSVDILSWKAEDGMEVGGYLTYPDGRQADALPLIVFPHGGPFARDWLTFDRIAQYWATRGYAVFQPNFRGSTGFGRTFQEAGYKQYGGTMIDDISSGVEMLIKAGRVDANRICTAGISYGGYASLMLPIKSDRFACAVSINGVSDLILQTGIDIRTTKGRQQQKETSDWIKMAIGDRKRDKKMLDHQSPLKRYREIKTPLLLIAAKDDKTVDVSNSRKLNEIMAKAEMDVRYIEFEQGGHSLIGGGTMRRMLAETEAFFYEHIGKTEVN